MLFWAFQLLSTRGTINIKRWDSASFSQQMLGEHLLYKIEYNNCIQHRGSPCLHDAGKNVEDSFIGNRVYYWKAISEISKTDDKRGTLFSHAQKNPKGRPVITGMFCLVLIAPWEKHGRLISKLQWVFDTTFVKCSHSNSHLFLERKTPLIC